MITINKRLALCASYVSRGGIAVDVGTDHAYLSAFLVENKISKQVFACDINEKPLLIAKKTLERYRIEDKVVLIKSDGLENVPPEKVTDVIIAGMGGELISQIIEKSEWLKCGINLVLQPMSRVSLLRKWLYSNGFKIKFENAVQEENFIYTIINAEFCGRIVDVDDFFAETGKLDLEEEISQKYLARQVNRLQKVYKQMSISDNKKDEAEKVLNLSKEILAKIH